MVSFYKQKVDLYSLLHVQAPIISTSGSNKMAWLGMAAQRDLLLDGWEIPSGSIILEDQLGEGCFGEVHRGVVKGPLPHSYMMKSTICKTVAIKFLKRKPLFLGDQIKSKLLW